MVKSIFITNYLKRNFYFIDLKIVMKYLLIINFEVKERNIYKVYTFLKIYNNIGKYEQGSLRSINS